MADYNLGPFRPNPRGEYDSTVSYKFLDWVTCEGGSYLCINYDTIDGTACIGVHPFNDSNSELYWMCLTSRISTEEIVTEKYSSFITVKDGNWNFEDGDKCIIPESGEPNLIISNVYDGCCGIIVTKNKNLVLPNNSAYAVDYNYVTLLTNQIYMYSFVYCDFGNGLTFLWHRTVLDI